MMVAAVKNFVYITDILLMIVMPGYTMWNWRLALNGATQVEHTKRLFRFRDRADKCIDVVGGTRNRMHGIKGITQDDTMNRRSDSLINMRKRNTGKTRRSGGGDKSLASLSTTAGSTSGDASPSTTRYSNLNLSDIESDDSFECEDELILEDDAPEEEIDEESIIVPANIE